MALARRDDQAVGAAMRGALKVILALVGVAALAWFLLHADLREIWRTCLSLGWTAPVLFTPYLLVYLADTLGWWFCFRQPPPYLTLMRIRWAGEAVNNVLPSAYLGGEALKIYSLGKRGIPAAQSAPAAVLSKTVQTLAQVMCIALGGLAFVSLGVAPPVFQKAMVGVFFAGIAVVGGLFWLQRHGVFGFFFGLFRRLRWRAEAWKHRESTWRQFDQDIREFYVSQRGRFLASCAAYLAGWLLDAAEIYLAAYLLAVPLSIAQAVAIETFVSVAKALSIFIPGALGVQESSVVFLCRMAGVPDSFGFTYAVLRRARELIFVLIGWGWLCLEESTMRGLAQRVKASSV
jgi:uncharacterized protein (TIRG00374 family)